MCVYPYVYSCINNGYVIPRCTHAISVALTHDLGQKASSLGPMKSLKLHSRLPYKPHL